MTESFDDTGLHSLPVDLSLDAVVRDVNGNERVVIKHFVDELGELMIVVYENGEAHKVPARELLREAAARHRLENPLIVVDHNTELLNWLSEEKKREAFELAQHVYDVTVGRGARASDRRPNPYDPETTDETTRRQAKVAELGVSDSNFGRWITRVKRDGPLGMARHSTRKLRSLGIADVPPEILAVVRQYLMDRDVSSKKTRLSEHAEVLDLLRRQRLVSRTPGVIGPYGAPLPLEADVLSAKTFAKLVRQFGRGRDPRTAKTRQQQRNRKAVNGLRHRGFDFGDRIEMDSTPVDIHVAGPDGPQRVWAVFAVCVSTRYCWLRLVPGPPRGVHLGLLLWDILGGTSLWGDPATPSATNALSTIPNVVTANLWRGAEPPPATLPGCIAVDHGAEEENHYFIGLCAQLGITLYWARTMDPTYKAYIESLIRKFGIACELVPGHKGNTVENKPSRQARRLLTFEQARAAFRVWPEWVANQPHTGLTDATMPNRHLTPLEAVSVSLTRGVPIRVLTDPTFALRLLPHLSLVPHDDGVTWQKRRYTCADYEPIIKHSTSRGTARRPLTFYYDPDAPGSLFWPEPGTFKVRTLHAPGVASGVTPAFAEVREALRMSLQGQRWPTHDEMASRRADLLELMAQAWRVEGLDSELTVVPINRGKKTATRKARQRLIDSGGWDLNMLADLTADYQDEVADRFLAGFDDWEEA
ncbi:hypothetical protein GCM10022237_46150 [Nocardioides ginsengisoli]|uniref:Integrase catalytic domain-containing protein n=1 Tax=Nocardioides ginsengisoli TaxID=363868 RepID=A0ABW3W5T2_9ACTN